MRPLHPYIIGWLEEQEKHDLIHRIIKGEERIGRGGNGTVTIHYRDGKVQKVTAEKKENV